MTFHIGQRVVCVKDLRGCGYDELRWPDHVKVNGVYVVRGTYFPEPMVTLLYLEEFVAPLVGSVEPGFCAQYFRPAVERKTDISIFTAMLKPSRVSGNPKETEPQTQ